MDGRAEWSNMKKPVDNSQNCACGACKRDRYKYYQEMEQYKKWCAEQNLNSTQQPNNAIKTASVQ